MINICTVVYVGEMQQKRVGEVLLPRDNDAKEDVY